MSKFLHIKMINKGHAYPDEPGADYEAWGRIILFHESEGTTNMLLDTEWDLLIFSEWFIANKQALCLETLTMPGNQRPHRDESVAQAIYRFSQREFSETEDELELEWFDFLYQFGLRHNLWYSLMGSKVSNIFLCCNHGGGEISCFNDSENWQYEFDMKEFMEEVKQELEKFLLFCNDMGGTKRSLLRAELNLKNLQAIEESECCKDNFFQ